MAKSIKITSSTDTSYTVKPLGEDKWGAYLDGESVPQFVFEAKEDTSREEFVGEVDYLEMIAGDDDDIADDDNDGSRYSYDDEDRYGYEYA